ncbi:MAG: DUF5671 domain-containing protein [Candidatus Gracilibacteria bacterium]|nr:DUF5671 domain-containing protein [Candidatus Gracilibacteria bacterium]
MPPSKKVKTSPKDVFLQLLVIVAMYFSAITMITLLWQLVNLNIADPLANDYYYGTGRPYFGALRFAISSLIVAFPTLIVAAYLQNKGYKKEKAKLDLGLRKWLIYLTIFVAALVMAGDLIAIVYNYLEGDLTMRFTLKALSMVLVLGVVFTYNLWDLKRSVPWKGVKLFSWGVSLLVLVALVVGFITVGSPGEERLYRFDGERVQDLDSMQWQITNYWQHKEVLPGSLIDLNDEVGGYLVPTDPENSSEYEYRVLGDKTFELCATFNKQSASLDYPQINSDDYMKKWEHEAGRVCFERTIDEELYPQVKY